MYVTLLSWENVQQDYHRRLYHIYNLCSPQIKWLIMLTIYSLVRRFIGTHPLSDTKSFNTCCKLVGEWVWRPHLAAHTSGHVPRGGCLLASVLPPRRLMAEGHGLALVTWESALEVGVPCVAKRHTCKCEERMSGGWSSRRGEDESSSRGVRSFTHPLPCSCSGCCRGKCCGFGWSCHSMENLEKKNVTYC